jgi:hypothetical protein
MEKTKSPSKLEQEIEQTTERIVIDYANFSGRESTNRSIFRDETRKHIELFAQKQKEESNNQLANTILMAKEGWIDEGRIKQKSEIVEMIETMKNHNEMIEMDGKKYTEGFEKALEDILKKLEV